MPTRTVRVTALYTSAVNNAILVKDGINLNGFVVNTDSYDSMDPNYSGSGGVYDPTKNKDGGNVALLSDQPGAFDAGNSKILGKVATGENSWVDVGAQGSIGSMTWVTNGTTGIQPGWSSDDALGEIPDVVAPYTSAPPPPGGSVTFQGTNYSMELPDGEFEVSTFRGRVLVTGNATLVVTDRLQFQGLDCIRILPGASLRLYVAARDADIGGLGVINESGNTDAFSYFGLPSNKSLSISGGGELSGLIYAPQAEVTLNGGGNVYGAIIARSAVLNGGTNIHLDESLGLWRRIVGHVRRFHPVPPSSRRASSSSDNFC